ncbi:MAG: 2-oxoacid:ferredoxin oxidoreductase subunit beta, partial [Anaerolineae bacterium]|nr:2-oxoacid:ferredoxin oxidoreductase subunit beta [Anaerolineae bacterium]
EDEVIEVDMHNGTYIRLKKLNKDHDPRSKAQAIGILEEAQREGLFLTGLLYYEEPRPTLAAMNKLGEAPLSSLNEEQSRPTRAQLDEVMKAFM